MALVTANIEGLIEFAQQQKFDYIDLEDLASNEKVHKLFAERNQDKIERLYLEGSQTPTGQQ